MQFVLFLMHVLDVIFFAGIAGSLLVVTLKLAEDIQDLFLD
jgi:Na+/H+-dicarboxylate symporter